MFARRILAGLLLVGGLIPAGGAAAKRVPPRAVTEIRRLTAGFHPLRLTAAALRLAH